MLWIDDKLCEKGKGQQYANVRPGSNSPKAKKTDLYFIP